MTTSNIPSNIPPVEPNWLSVLKSIPLPEIVKKNLMKSVSHLVMAAVDVPVAWLESKAKRMRAESEGLSQVIKASASAASNELKKDSNLIDRSVEHFTSKLFKEQQNREKVAELAIGELSLNPPSEDTQSEIDPDWLEYFSRIAETKSNEEVQLILSKILAGEIRKPGSFGARTIQTLSLLNQQTAKLFQNFCNLTFHIEKIPQLTCLIHQFCEAPGSNGLLKFGLSYSDLTVLQDEGLIKQDLNSWRNFDPHTFLYPFNLGSQKFEIESIGSLPGNKIKLGVLNYTAAGLELREVMSFSTNSEYNQEFIKWAQPTLDITYKS